jgi:penicillin amidase
MGGGTAWLIAGRRTRSGAPILVADLQLPPTLPALVYEMHVRGGALELVGAMVPGVPVVWAGRSLHVAWAVTPGRAVTVDLYRESVRPEKGIYQNGRRWVPIEEREELIVVAEPDGSVREERLIVRSTRHGPIIDELLQRPDASVPFELSRNALALAWTGMREGDGITSMLALTTAKDAGEIQSALETHHEPVIALVYADDAGRGGMQLAGWLPYRPLPSGFVPVPGRTTVYDWRQSIDPLALPARRLGTDDGKGADYVIASDNPLDDDLAGGGIEWLWRADEQARVLRQALRGLLARSEQSGEKVDLREVAAVQASVGIGARPPLVVAIAQLVADGPPLAPEAREILNLLEGWDGRLDPDSRGAAAYHVLLDHLVAALFSEPFGEDLLERYLALPGARPHAVVTSIVTTADRLDMSGGWSDVDRVTAIVRDALRRTWVSLSHRLGPSRIDWTWGALHSLELRPFATNALAANGELGMPERRPVGGDGTTPRVTRPRSLSEFEVVEASSYRVAIDLSAPDLMVSTLSPGQTEHPLHPHSTDGLERWEEGRPSVVLTNRLLIEESSSERLILDPAT